MHTIIFSCQGIIHSHLFFRIINLFFFPISVTISCVPTIVFLLRLYIQSLYSWLASGLLWWLHKIFNFLLFSWLFLFYLFSLDVSCHVGFLDLFACHFLTLSMWLSFSWCNIIDALWSKGCVDKEEWQYLLPIPLLLTYLCPSWATMNGCSWLFQPIFAVLFFLTFSYFSVILFTFLPSSGSVYLINCFKWYFHVIKERRSLKEIGWWWYAEIIVDTEETIALIHSDDLGVFVI